MHFIPLPQYFTCQYALCYVLLSILDLIWFDVQWPSVIFHWLNTFILVQDDSPRSSIAASVGTWQLWYFCHQILNLSWIAIFIRSRTSSPVSCRSVRTETFPGSPDRKTERGRSCRPEHAGMHHVTCTCSIAHENMLKTDIIWFSKSV